MRPPTHVTARYRPPARGSRCAVAVRGARMYDTLQGARGRWRLAAGRHRRALHDMRCDSVHTSCYVGGASSETTQCL